MNLPPTIPTPVGEPPTSAPSYASSNGLGTISSNSEGGLGINEYGMIMFKNLQTGIPGQILLNAEGITKNAEPTVEWGSILTALENIVAVVPPPDSTTLEINNKIIITDGGANQLTFNAVDNSISATTNLSVAAITTFNQNVKSILPPQAPEDLINLAYLQTFPPSSQLDLFLNYASFPTPPIDTYSLLSGVDITPATTNQQTITAGSPVLITGFANQIANLSVSSYIPAGIWNMSLFCNVSTSTPIGNLNLFWRLYGRTALGIETQISGDSSYFNLITIAPVVVQTAMSLGIPETDITAYESLVVKIYGTISSGSRIVNTFYEGTNQYSYVKTSFGAYVPVNILGTTNTWTAFNTFDNGVESNGTTSITGALYDSVSLAGTAGQVLSSTGSAIAWTTPINPTIANVLTAGNVSSNQSITGLNNVSATTFTGLASSATNLAGGLGGQVLYQSAVDTTAKLENGTAGYVLTANGTTLAPSWSTPIIPTIANVLTAGNVSSNQSMTGLNNVSATTFTGLASSATLAVSASNLAGGLGGQVLYQSAVDTTAKLANGNAGYVLTANGTTLAPSWSTVPIPTTLVSTGTFYPTFVALPSTQANQSISVASTLSYNAGTSTLNVDKMTLAGNLNAGSLQLNSGNSNFICGTTVSKSFAALPSAGLNTFINTEALAFTTGLNNVAIGIDSFKTFITSYGTTAIGTGCLRDKLSGNNCCAVGSYAGYLNAAGDDITLFGGNAFSWHTTGANLISVGSNNGQNFVSGINTIMIGNRANIFAPAIAPLNNNIIMGNNASTTGANCIIIGNDQVNTVANRIQIGGTLQTSLRIPVFTVSGLLTTDATGVITSTLTPSVSTLTATGLISSAGLTSTARNTGWSSGSYWLNIVGTTPTAVVKNALTHSVYTGSSFTGDTSQFTVNPNTGVFQVLTAGTYKVSFTITMNNNGGQIQSLDIGLYSDVSTPIHTINTACGTGGSTNTLNCIVRLDSAIDYFIAYLTGNFSGTVTTTLGSLCLHKLM